MTISWSQALAWRMRRHLLEPAGTESVEAVVGRLGAVLAMDERLAEFAVRARRLRSGPGEVARALDEGRIIKSFAFRGATHYLSAEDGGARAAIGLMGRARRRRRPRRRQRADVVADSVGIPHRLAQQVPHPGRHQPPVDVLDR